MDVVALALACYRTPLAYKDRLTLNAPLPEDMDRLLGLANGSPEIMDSAAIKTGARPQELRDAARFCIQQWCLMRGASHYRVLGLNPGASPTQIKDHHRLLMRLLHPDRAVGRETWTENYAARVNEAWTALSRSEFQVAHHMNPPLRKTAEAAVSKLNWKERWTKPTSQSALSHARKRLIAFRRWFPVVILGGFGLVALLILDGPFLSMMPHKNQFKSALEMPVIYHPGALPIASDHSAVSAFLTTPDWQKLDQREWQSPPQTYQSGSSDPPQDTIRQGPLVVEASLLDRLRMEQFQLEEQLKSERIRIEQEWAKYQAVKQRLEQLRVEQAQAERAQTELLAAANLQLEKLSAEQARAKPLANELRTERQRLDLLKAQLMPSAPVVMEEPLTIQLAHPEVVVANSEITKDPEMEIKTLDDLVDRYSKAYQQGDLDRLMTLFMNQEHGRNAADWQRIRRRYANLFSTHMIREFKLHDLIWDIQGESATGMAHFELSLRHRYGGNIQHSDGNIRFEVRRQGDQFLIDVVDQEIRAKSSSKALDNQTP